MSPYVTLASKAVSGLTYGFFFLLIPPTITALFLNLPITSIFMILNRTNTAIHLLTDMPAIDFTIEDKRLSSIQSIDHLKEIFRTKRYEYKKHIEVLSASSVEYFVGQYTRSADDPRKREFAKRGTLVVPFSMCTTLTLFYNITAKYLPLSDLILDAEFFAFLTAPYRQHPWLASFAFRSRGERFVYVEGPLWPGVDSGEVWMTKLLHLVHFSQEASLYRTEISINQSKSITDRCYYNHTPVDITLLAMGPDAHRSKKRHEKKEEH